VSQGTVGSEPPHRLDLREKLFFFLSGIIISIPLTVFVQSSATSLFAPEAGSRIVQVVILAPFIEEFAKAYPLFYRHGETQRSIFSLGFLVGLGFGVSEFLLYVIPFGVSPLVRLPGIIFHAASASIIAYGIATKRTIIFYAIAVFLHFLNNFSATLGAFWLVGGTAAFATTYALSAYLYSKTSERFIDGGPRAGG